MAIIRRREDTPGSISERFWVLGAGCWVLVPGYGFPVQRTRTENPEPEPQHLEPSTENRYHPQSQEDRYASCDDARARDGIRATLWG